MESVVLKLPGTEDFFTREAYNVLRTNLQFCGRDIRVIAITSCQEKEGKTTVSLHLARSLAELGKRVLVIDADMRKSVLADRNTTAKRAAGLREALTGMRELSECIYATQYPTLHLMFAGKYPRNPVELLDGSDFKDLIAEMRTDYDYVIVDTPSLGSVIDAAVIAPNCDGMLLVIGDGNVRRREAQGVVAQLARSGGRILGVVRNNTKKRSGSYYYKNEQYDPEQTEAGQPQRTRVHA